MRSRRAITVVGCHAGGEVGNVIVGGVLPPNGANVFEQMQALRADDSLRPPVRRGQPGQSVDRVRRTVRPQRGEHAEVADDSVEERVVGGRGQT